MGWDRSLIDPVVAPSIYAADFANLGTQVKSLLDAGARIFHFDIGDGHFVDEITMGPIVMRSIVNLVHDGGGFFDCHLMVSQPRRHLEQIKSAGGDSVTFHLEADDDPAGTLAEARAIGLHAGIAFDPETSVEAALRAGEGADVVLCMSIHPGLSGQEFMPVALDRIGTLRRGLPDSVVVEVDGGVHMETIGAARSAGADVLVSGSGIFWGDDPGAAYRGLLAAAMASNAHSAAIASTAEEE